MKLGLVLAGISLSVVSACGARRPPPGPPPAIVGAPVPVAEPDPAAVETDPEPAPASADAEAAVPVLPDDPTWGDAQAPVTIVEFADFQCPFSMRVQPTLALVEETYGPSKVRIVWKNYPLPFHNRARAAHDAAMAVHQLGGNRPFWYFHERLFANQKDLTDENFTLWAREAGVNTSAFERALRAKDAAAHVERDLALVEAIRVRGTPNFRINGVDVSGAQPFTKFKEVIDREFVEVEKLRAAGVQRERLYATRVASNTPPKQAEPPAAAEPPEDTTIWNIPVDPQDPVQGPPDALVTMVVWGDFQCPFTKRVMATVSRLRSEYASDLRLVWKDNPLPFHPRARPAATLARFAFQAQGSAGFWHAHDRLFQSQAKLENDDLRAIAQDLKLPWSQVKVAIDKDRFGSEFDAGAELAGDFNARGTPHFFVNGRRVAGAQPYEKFHEVIEQQLARARAEVAAGTPRAGVYAALMKDAKGPPPPETKVVAAPPKNAPFRGSANARAVVQVWGDFQCPFTLRLLPTLDALEKAYPGRVKLVWRNNPLPFHKDAELAAEAALEAQKQLGNAGFWRFHAALFAAQSQPGGLERPGLEAIAQQQGLDLGKFRSALDAHTHLPRVKLDIDLAQKAGIVGTPATVVGKYFVSGAQPIGAFKRAFQLASKP